MRKIGYRTADEVVTKLGVPVLAVVPDMVPEAGRGRQRRRSHFKLALAVAAAVMVCGALAWLLI